MPGHRILIIEDERITALDLRQRLEKMGYVVVAGVADGASALSAAEKGVDLALVDIHIEGDMDGIETAAQLRERHGIPSVFLTAYGDDSILRRALTSQPYGYLIKPFDARELHATLQTALVRHEFERDLRKGSEHNDYLAHHDSLTGLPNRLLFVDRLGHALDLARRSLSRCAVLFIDLDGFKSVNDGLGHDCGDQLLQVLAARMRRALRRSDTLARLGGDEFVVVMEESVSSRDDARNLAEKLLEVAASPVSTHRGVAQVSASIGIAVYPEDGGDAAALISAADQAMYSAKQKGRNQWCYA
jgi:diguanylate cyclase